MTMGKSKQKQNKRWFVNAGFGPFSLSFGNGAGASTGKGKRSLPAIDNERYNVVAETNTGLLHGTVYTYNPIAQIAQSTNVGGRLGNTIHIDRISWSGIINANTTGALATSSWRLMVVLSTKQYNPGLTLGSGLGTSDLFFTSLNPLTAHPDPRLVYVLCDEVVEVPVYGNVNHEKAFTHHCDIGKDFEYAGGTSIYGVSANIYCVVIPQYPAGVTGTTVVGDMVWEVAVAFRDI